jgi:lipid-binding SYLF domain-containing protein
MKRTSALGSLVILALFSINAQLPAQQMEGEIVTASSDILKELTSSPDKGLPRKMLQEAQAIAVFPHVIKAGFVVGGRHGRGVISIRQDDGSWSNPLPLSITGGSVGFQAGAQSIDLVLVFRSKRGIEPIIQGKGKLKLGGDVSVAAGPVGREAGTATDPKLNSEIFTYSRTRGLFAGASLSGAVIKPDITAIEHYYASDELTPKEVVTRKDIPIRESTQTLLTTLGELATPPPATTK